jgi:ABC-2 type transport system ATP-binding protein
MTQKNAALVFDSVVKEYPQGLLGRKVLAALRGISFHVERGEVFGLIGPNRAGKTTLVKILLSLCRPTHGSVERLGRPSRDRSTLARVGYVHENPAFPRYFSAAALLEYYGALSLLPEAVVKERTPKLLELVGLADRCREPISNFSKGMLQRLALAQALINDPELLVLDEPGEGLDFAAQQLLRQVVGDLRGRGRSVLYVSHLLPEVERLCDRVGVLVRGRLKYVGPVSTLLTDDAGAARSLEAAVQALYQSASDLEREATKSPEPAAPARQALVCAAGSTNPK